MGQTISPVAEQVTIGIDIGKQRLDVHSLPDGTSQCFPNDTSGITALVGWARERRPTRILFEATGAYHRTLENSLRQAGLPGIKLNPWRVRRFAEALGTRAKTDAVDATVLARFGVSLQPAIPAAADADTEQLKDLLAARLALIKDRTAARQRGTTRTLQLLVRQGQDRLRQIDKQIKAIDRACLALIAASPRLQARFDILTSIPGVGPVLAITLLALLPELGELDAKAIASLAGVAPVDRQSGNWKGKCFIQGGRKPVRDALYMPALVAIRFNPPLKAQYEAMMAAGKPAKLAIVATMRRLLVLANALLRDNRRWTLERDVCAV